MKAIIDTEMLWRQFGAAIDMLGDTLRECPDELWEETLWEDEPDQWVAAGFSAYWYLCYHTLFWLDLYLTGAEEGFAPPEPFDLVEMEEGEILPRTYTAKNCSAIWSAAGRSAGRRSARCRANKPPDCAGLPGVRSPLPSSSSTICAMCRSTPHNYACSWGNGGVIPIAGYLRPLDAHACRYATSRRESRLCLKV